MKNSARLKAVEDLLDLVLTSKKPADDLFVNFCRERRYIGSQDRRVISNMFFDLLRSYHSLVAALKTDDSRMLALAFWFEQHLTFDNLESDAIYGIRYPDLIEEQTIVLSLSDYKPFEIPQWTKPYFKDDLEEIKALHTRAPFDVRINPLQTNREEALKELKRTGVKCQSAPLSPFGIRLSERIPLQDLDLWKKGGLEIQDEGAQLIAYLSDVQPGQQVLDYCAGAGGKALLMAALMENKGRLIATDLHPWRLQQGEKRYRRAGVHNLQIKELTDTKWWKRHRNSFDRVLIDVPCSGSGTWRRNPDLKMRLQESDLKEIVEVQRSILEITKKYVKPGGLLIYATCSMWSVENEDQIEKFLAENLDFESETLAKKFEKGHIKYGLQLTPFQHGCDGFYIALLRKKM